MENQPTYSKDPRVAGGQAPGVTSSGPTDEPTETEFGGRDVLLLHDIPGHLSYRAIHDKLKPYGDVMRIRLVYDNDCPSNRCYITFLNTSDAVTAFRAVRTSDFPDCQAELLSSANVSETENDYVPNVFERTAEETCSASRRARTPRWFVA